jgi:hypothetical protein
MLRDFRDGNKDIVTMFRGTDKTHSFRLIEASGSRFNWDDYNITCEGRLSPANEQYNFTFSVDHYEVDGIQFGIILFPKEIITGYVRENLICWRVMAEDKTTNLVSVINYGEILLKDF